MKRCPIMFAMFAIVVAASSVSAQLPKKFDLRNVSGKNYVTPVKSQKSGTCWCHGTMSGIEGNLLMTGNWTVAGQAGVPNMAEYHLDWWCGFNQVWNFDLTPNVADPNAVPTHNGGDYKIFTSYMSRLEGPIRESDAPGDNTSAIPTQTACPLTKSTYMRWYVPHINWYFIQEGSNVLKNIDTIKRALMKYGVMPTNYYVGADSKQKMFNDGSGNIQTTYQDPATLSDANHSVAIVGWNDSVLTMAGATKLGAWLCKNSWGATNTPFLWISYYDKHCCRNAEMSVVSFDSVMPLPYKYVYSWDYHGWRDTYTEAKEGFNKFVAARNEYIVAVSIFTTVDKEDFTVKIYDTYATGALSGELATETGYFPHQGYHTVTLTKPVKLARGNDFFVYLQLKNGGLPYDRTSIPPVLTLEKPKAPTIVKSIAALDQSYYRTAPTAAWLDFYNHPDTLDWGKSSNLCIKAYTVDSVLTAMDAAPVKPLVAAAQVRNFPNPFAAQTSIVYTLASPGTVSVSIRNAQGRLVRTLASGAQAAGRHSLVWNGTDNQNRTLANGVYYVFLSGTTAKGAIAEKQAMFMVR